MEVKEMNKELQGSNFLVTVLLTIMCSIIDAAYIAEFAKGARSLGYVALTVVLCTSLFVACWIVYNKQKDSPYIKHVLGIGWPIFYAYILFTTDNTLAFTYTIPLLIVVSVYEDSKLCVKECIGFVSLNVIQVIYFFYNGTFNEDTTASVEIQILLIILVSTFLCNTVHRVEINNRERNRRINEEMEKTKALLERIVAISKETNESIDEVCVDINDLGKSIASTSQAMENVDSGAA